MSTNAAILAPLHVDVSGVRNSRARDEVREALGELGCQYHEFDVFWPLLTRGEAGEIPANSLVCGDLSGIVRAYTSTQRHRWISGIRATRVFILAFVRTRTDESYASFVDDLVRTSDLRVSVCRFRPGARAGLAECVNQAVASLDPASVLDVRYSRADESIWVEFGDGLSGSLSPASFGFGEPWELVLETATVGPYNGGVQVLNRAGGVIDLDGGALRALLDGRFAAKLARQADGATVQLGERLKRHRVRLEVTQVQLAERSGLDQAIISKLERGRHQPRWDTLQRYAQGLGITPERLLAPAP